METRGTGPAGESIDTPRHRALGTTSRVGLLRLARAVEGITAAEAAERTGLHLSTVRAHLDRLVAAGLLVKAKASGGLPGRPAWRYRAAADDPAPAPYRSLAAALLDHLATFPGDVRANAARVGQGWGRRLVAAADPGHRPIRTVLEVLTGLGFTPEVIDPDQARTTTTGPGRPTVIELRTCPFLELVHRNPDAMCGLHLGVIRGALEHAGGSGAAAELEPFGTPTACLVRIAATSDDQGSMA